MTIGKADWIARCAGRILALDPALAADEANQLARDLYAFERTRALEPEAAVDFVQEELRQPQPRFERRAGPR